MDSGQKQKGKGAKRVDPEAVSKAGKSSNGRGREKIIEKTPKKGGGVKEKKGGKGLTGYSSGTPSPVGDSWEEGAKEPTRV